jgi:hypothetical protein
MEFTAPSVYLIFEPYWDPGVKFTRSYRTNIMSALTRAEQRSMLRTLPIHTLEYTIVTKNYEQTSRLKRYLKKYLPHIWGIPVWVYGMPLTASVSVGATSLSVVTTIGKEIDRFNWIIIKSTKGLAYYYDCVKVSSFTDTTINLETPLTFSWDSGVKVYPMMRSELGDAQQLSLPTEEHFTGTFLFTESFIESDTVEDAVMTITDPTPTFQTYLDEYVFDLFPLWSTEPSLDIYFEALPKFSGLGRDIKESIQTVSPYIIQNKYLFQNELAVKQMVDFFDNRIGRLSTFWLPSWQKDIKLVQDISPSDTTIHIVDIDYATFYPDPPGLGRYLFFYVRKNHWFARKVTSVISSTQLQISSSLGEVFSASNMVCFLYHVRFDIDTLELDVKAP